MKASWTIVIAMIAIGAATVFFVVWEQLGAPESTNGTSESSEKYGVWIRAKVLRRSGQHIEMAVSIHRKKTISCELDVWTNIHIVFYDKNNKTVFSQSIPYDIDEEFIRGKVDESSEVVVTVLPAGTRYVAVAFFGEEFVTKPLIAIGD